MSSSPPPPPHHGTSNWDSHEMHQRRANGGFQKLASNEPSPAATPVNYYQQQPPYPYYHDNTLQSQPYYAAPPPPQPIPMNGSPYPILIQQQQQQLPYGYDRHPIQRFLLGPVRTPVFSYVSALAMVAGIIYEFVHFHNLTGSIIETSPFNPMIGPSFQVLVNVGARFTPCIRSVPSLPSSTLIGYCYQNATSTCTVEEMCGFGGFPSGIPNQAFRLVLPIFLHGGVIHILVNMLTHLRLGVDLERALGTPRYILLYMASGIYGFVLSAMLSQNLTASTGCSGALFGLIGYMFVDVLVNWKILPNPVGDLISLFITTIISLALGLLPGLDNFAHIGGFAVGILMGMFVAPMRPMATRRVVIITWILRIVALALLVVLFAVSIREFYSAEDPSKICPNCKYLSCIPVNNWCDPVSTT